jgi:2-keto-4-pentenoate hydratase
MTPSSPALLAADRLREAAEKAVPCRPVRDLMDAIDADTGYAAQEINTLRALSAGRRLVGRKIGLTSRAVQAQLGVDQPDYGMLFADMAVADGEEIDIHRLLQPRIEGEIAFRLSRDLPHPDITPAELATAIDCAFAALEIVDSRIAGWDIRLADTIADNASSGLFAIASAPCRLEDFDHRLCGMVLERRGEPVSVGAGAACLGNPVTATLWLARRMAAIGRPLQAGDIVLSGALGPMVAVQPGDHFDLRINGVGSLRAAFSRKDV